MSNYTREASYVAGNSVQAEGVGFFARRERRATRRRAEPRARGTARLRFFEVLAAGDAALFVEEMEWTIVEVCDVILRWRPLLVLRERWENKVTAGCK